MFTNKTVLIVGAATSGMEIARDLSPYAKKVYSSSKPGNYWLPAFYKRVPNNVTVVPEIASFVPPSIGNSDISQGNVKLANKTVLSGINHIIFATGYRHTFPFFPQYHDASLRANDTAPVRQPIVTDGTHLRSLYLDLFYIEEPTLTFIDMNTAMQSFVYAEYLSVALAKVWKGEAHIPTQKKMWKFYWDHVKARGGHVKGLQTLGEKRARDLIRYFVGWLNAARGRTVEPPPAIGRESTYYYIVARLGYNILASPPMNNEFLLPQMAVWRTSGWVSDEAENSHGDLSVFLDSW